jgi:alpha-beta hydrolase superfamily lysophospholipase
MRHEIAFHADGVALRGWLHRPEGDEPVATIIATHGLASTAEFLEPLAAELVASGFGLLAYDHRCLGRSDGEPRQEIDLWRQVQDMRTAISCISQRPDVDAGRIGLWGASMGGAVVLTAAAFDTRVRAVVGVVPVVSGWHAAQAMTPAERRAAMQAALDEDRFTRARGLPPATVTMMPEKAPEEVAALPDPGLRFLYESAAKAPSHRPYVTLRSFENIRDFEPLAHAHRIAPRPLMVIVAEDDRMASPTEARRLFDSVESDHKVFKVMPGEHYLPLDGGFADTARASIDFFGEHLAD